MAVKSKILGDDPRTPKLIGMFLLFLALYLFIACFSYLFTWKDDQDKVWQFSLDLIFQDVEVSNWLGRLGAVVSHFMMYWLFGVPSFFIIYLLLQYGLGIINEVPLYRFRERLRTSMIWMVGLSILLGFIFFKTDFSWGGNFGRMVSAWLINFVGVFGMFVLVIFILCFLIIWTYNPELKGLTLQNAFSQLKLGIMSLWDDRYKKDGFSPRSLTIMPRDKSGKKDIIATLEDESVSFAPVKAGERNAIEEALDLPAAVLTPSVSRASDASKLEITDENELDMSTRSATKTPSLRVGDTELEIEETTSTAPSMLDDTGSVAET